MDKAPKLDRKVKQPPCVDCGRSRQHMKGCPSIGHEDREEFPKKCITPNASKTVMNDRKQRNPAWGDWRGFEL